MTNENKQAWREWQLPLVTLIVNDGQTANHTVKVIEYSAYQAAQKEVKILSADRTALVECVKKIRLKYGVDCMFEIDETLKAIGEA